MPPHACDDSVFTALADPTRRAMLHLLAERSRNVNELVDAFDVSQPAISRHLRVLRSVNLVRDRAAGRERIYELNPRPLREVVDWLTFFEKFWSARLDALGDLLDQTNPQKERKKRR